MRILFLARASLAHPGGTGMRARLTINALERLGAVQVVGIRRADDWAVADGWPEPGTWVERSHRRPSRWERVAGPFTGGTRAELRADFPLEQQRVREVVDGPVALTWCVAHPVTHSLPDELLGPVVTDLVDWEGEKWFRESVERFRTSPSPRRAASVGLSAVDVRTMRRSVRRARDRSAVTLAATTEDVRSLGLRSVDVLENAYPTPDREPPDRRPSANDGVPVDILLAGSMGYGPNAEGVTWMVDDVLPELVTRVPEARLRIAGSRSERLPVTERPGVTVVGSVPSMQPELDRASLAVAPLLRGTGSRQKVLEAFANRIPVVSTTVGASSLAVVPGTHLLIADTAHEFAEACQLVLTDRELARSLADAAAQLYDQRYSTEVFSANVVRIAVDAIRVGAPR